MFSKKTRGTKNYGPGLAKTSEPHKELKETRLPGTAKMGRKKRQLEQLQIKAKLKQGGAKVIDPAYLLSTMTRLIRSAPRYRWA